MMLGFIQAFGQQSIVTLGTAVTQNFTSLGSTAAATLPTGWRMGATSTSTDWSSLQTATVLAAGTSGTGVLTGTSAGKAYNFANGVTASSTDRAIGFLTSSSFASPRSIIYAFTNNTGSTVNSLNLAWNYEKYRSGSRAFNMTFFHGSTTNPATSVTAGDQAYSADLNNTVISNPPLSAAKSFTITGLSIAIGSTYYLRWTYTGTGGSTNAQALGVDDFSITLNTAVTPPTIALSSPAQTGASNITQSSTDNIISHFQAAITVANATINTLAFTTTGTYLAGDLTGNFKLFYGTTNVFGSATQIATVASGASGTRTFTGLTQVINSGATGYFWITADASATSGGNRTLIVSANPVLTFASGTPTGTIAVGGTKTFITPTPTITLSSPSQTIASDINPSSNNNVLSHFQAAVTVASATINSLAFITTGTYLAGDLSGTFKLYYHSTNVFASASSIGTVAVGAAGTYTFTGLTQTISSGTTGYFWIVADASATSGSNRTLTISANPVLSFALGTPTGTIAVAGTKTFVTPSSPLLSAVTLTAFGSQCINGTYGPNSFTITGTALTTANVTVASLSGYEFATLVGGPFTSSLSLTQSGGAYSQAIFVRFIPTAAITYNGNIVVGGGGAANINVAASGTGINGTVAVTTTVASSITTTTASSGGTAISTTCGTIASKGVVWGLAANPTVPSANSTNDGSGTVNYSSSLTPLTPGTVYNYRAYATNSNGVTSYGSNLTLTTLSLEPTSHATSLTVTAPTINSLTLNFSAANTITNASGYIILQRIGAAPTGLPADAASYSVGNTIGDASVAAIITNTASTSTVISSLNSATTYYYTLIPFGYNGVNAGSYNYYISPTIPVANGTTTYSLTLGAGDIAFTAFQASAPDGIEFITLRRLDLRGLVITDNGILASNAMRSGEGNFTFPNTTAYADVPAGTIFRLDEATGTPDTESYDGVIHLYGNGSTILGVSNFAIATGGDQAIAYTGAAATPNFVAGIGGADGAANWNSGATSANDSKAPGTSSDFYMGTPDNGYYTGTVTGNATTIRTSAVTGANWTTSGSAQAARFNNKTILFNESNYSSGSITISSVTANSFTIDASAVTFSNESAATTRYAILIRSAAPSAPADRYTCYSGVLNDLTSDIGIDPTVISATTDICTGTAGNGTVIYFDYNLPSALVVNGLTDGTNYQIRVYAVNGNGYSANFSTTPASANQTTTTLTANVALSSPSQIAANNIAPGANNQLLSHFEIATTTTNATLNQVNFTTSGTYTAGELTGNFTLWYGTTNAFGSAISLATVAAAGPGTYSFTGLTQVLNLGTSRYFWITCNTNAAAITPRNIQVAANPVLTFVSAIQSGSISAGGIQTITPVLPVVTTDAVNTITENAAQSGGDVTYNGGATVTSRGVLWSTIVNPTMPSVNSTSNGVGTGIFTSSLSSLSPETQYFARAYAQNSAGYGYGSSISFMTLSNPPVAQAANLIANPFSTNQIDLSWDNAAFPGIGATVKGYLLLRATDPTIPTFVSTNGTLPSAGVGLIVSASIIDPTNIFSNTGLAGNTTYNYLLIPYTWDGINPETYHYLTTGAATASATTPPSSCTPPTLQASSPTSSSVTSSSALLSWTIGNGNRSIVIVKQGSASTSQPVDGVNYTANNNFGSGNIMGPQEYVCYNNNGATFTLIGLASSTTYHYTVYTFTTAGNCYLTPGVSGSFTTLSSPSIIETFEPGVKGTYPNGNATCALGIWNFDDALVGNTGFDRRVATKSARLTNNGIITMLFDKANGLGTVNIQHAKYGLDANTSWRMEVSDDGGASFNAYTSPTVFTTTTDINTTATFVVNIPGNNIRIRIVKLSGGASNLNLDQISLGNFISPNTVTTGIIAGSPFCVTASNGISVNVPFTSVGAYDASNVYTAQLSDATGSFAIPTDIGTLSSDLNSGTIAAEIPAGTQNGTLYRIRVISSTPAITGTQNGTNLRVFLNPPDVIGFYASISSPTALNLGWTNQTGCFDQILIVGRAASAVTALPTGDGTLYTASSVFGTGGSGGNLPANEFAVYKAAAGTTVNVSGLTTGTTYFFEIFTRKGLTWSDGVIVSATPINIAVGDYRSNGNGNYSAAGVWQTWNGGAWVAATNYPNSSGTSGSVGTVNVTVRNGHTITLDISRASQAIKNLTVEFGGKIFTNDSTYNGNRYLSVYGDISCLGTIGNGFNVYDNISLNIEGVQTTISGSGNFNASRLRKNYNTNTTTNLIIAINTGLKFASGVGSSSGTNIYSNTNNTVFNMTINENTSVTLQTSIGSSGNISIDGIDGSGSGERGGKFTVNGTLTVPGTLFAFTDNSVSPVMYEIGTSGIINCVNICTANTAEPAVATGSAAAGCTFRILNGGKLNLTGGVASDPNTYNKPFSVRTNTLSPYTFSTGLGTTNNIFDFQAGSTVQYSSNSGTMPIQSQTLIYSNLLITGAAIKTINSILNVNKDLTIQSPAVFNASGFDINIDGDWNNYGTIGFTEGTATVYFNGVDGQKISSSSYEDFYNVNIQNSSTNGVELNCDVNIANDLNLGTNGRLIFGFTPRTLTLTKMTAASNSWIGSSTALFDMSNANHTFIIGCESPNYTGTFLAGNLSNVIYNRTSAITLTDGNQSVQTDLTYANLTLSGTDNKNTNDDFAVTASLFVEGNTTQLLANTLSKTLSLGGDFTLSSGAQMNANCLNNLTLLTTDILIQSFNGNGKPFRFFDFNSTKTAGLLSLIGPVGNSSLRVKNDFILNYTASSLFEDNSDSIFVGDDVLIGGVGSSNTNYNFNGLLLMDGSNVSGDIQIADVNGTVGCVAHLGSLRIQTGENLAANKRVEICPLTGSANIVIKGNLDIVNGSNGAEFDANNNNLAIGGNWTNYSEAAFIEGINTNVTFNGSVLQTLNCIGGEEFTNFTINNSGAGLIINEDLQIDNNFVLTNGLIDLNNNNLHLGTNLSNAIVTGGSTTSYVIGWNGAVNGNIIHRVNGNGNYKFPIGDNTVGGYTPADVTFTTGSYNNATLTCTLNDGIQPDLLNPTTSTNYLSRYWTIEQTGVSNFLYNINYSYADATDQVGVAANMWPYKHNAQGWITCWGATANPGTFKQGAGSFNPGTKTFSWSGLNTFSDFTGNGNGSPLPISLIDFTATPENDVVRVEWSTLSETNNDYYTVERSKNGKDFESIYRLFGAGNSNELRKYMDYDNNPYMGLSYYRLKQTDFDGNFTYSTLRLVNFDKGNSNDEIRIVNHLNQFLLLSINFAEHQDIQIQIISTEGKSVQNLNYSQVKTQDIQIPLEQLANGIYVITISGKEVFNYKFSISK